MAAPTSNTGQATVKAKPVKPGRIANLRPWKPGQSGNPNGRPKIAEEVKELARAYTKDAVLGLAKLAGLVVDKETGEPIGKADSAAVCKAALDSLLDRAAGKPAQAVIGEGDDGVINVRFVA